ncbi:MAG: DUF2442 domain-containing protein [Pseudomonas sp.]
MATKTLSETQIREQIPAARVRARRNRREPWWPVSVRFNAEDRVLEINLRSQVSIHLPTRLFPELHRATIAQLKQVELAGEALRWSELDVDISFVGCLEKAFGAQLFAVAAGRMGGRVRSRKKAAAARANGARGGRPSKRANQR